MVVCYNVVDDPVVLLVVGDWVVVVHVAVVLVVVGDWVVVVHDAVVLVVVGDWVVVVRDAHGSYLCMVVGGHVLPELLGLAHPLALARALLCLLYGDPIVVRGCFEAVPPLR